ncbi:MAG: PD-(D/E)XK nuclease family protein, partial [Gemmatimonadota bacterium]|nr:PD-(D/E)XK nuclease family protein [Gemmatimonadota bacterium]
MAREIKQLIASGAAEPHEIAVVARSGREDTRRAYRALQRAGVPASARIRTPLVEITALQALLLVFRGAARDWDYQSLRAVLNHPYFDTKVDLRGIDFIASGRRVTGLDAWRDKLELALRLVRENARETWGKGLFEDRLDEDIAAFEEVRAKLSPLSEPRPEAEWVDLTLRLLSEDRGLFLLRRRLCNPAGERWDIVRLDQRGVIQLERLLREWKELELSDNPLEPGEWFALLRRLLEGNELAISTPAQKGVQVLEAHDAGLVPFAHTFVVHANDGEFPHLRSSATVLSNDERTRLAELGIPIDHREATLRRERTLWRAVTYQPGRVHVSYRTTNPSGTPLLPSLMVPAHDESEELPRLRRPTDRVSVSQEDADEEAAFALGRELGGGSREPGQAASGIQVAPAHPALLRQAIVAAVAESHRGPGLARTPDPGNHPALRPNPWNGELRDPDVLEVLREKFGDARAWSASQLESYARVPFQFLLERVLYVTGHEEAEEETSPLTFGGVAHEILEKFYAEYTDEPPSALAGESLARFEDIAEAVFEEREQGTDWLGLPALWEMSRVNVLDAVREYLRWELEYMQEKGERPFLAEHRFGYDEAVVLTGSDVRGA